MKKNQSTTLITRSTSSTWMHHDEFVCDYYCSNFDDKCASYQVVNLIGQLDLLICIFQSFVIILNRHMIGHHRSDNSFTCNWFSLIELLIISSSALTPSWWPPSVLLSTLVCSSLRWWRTHSPSAPAGLWHLDETTTEVNKQHVSAGFTSHPTCVRVHTHWRSATTLELQITCIVSRHVTHFWSANISVNKPIFWAV